MGNIKFVIKYKYRKSSKYYDGVVYECDDGGHESKASAEYALRVYTSGNPAADYWIDEVKGRKGLL